MTRLATTILLQTQEPNENAFGFLLPQGWHMRGGIFRINPWLGGWAHTWLLPKLDLVLSRDESDDVIIRALPDYSYYDPRYSPASAFGMYPWWSFYNGLPVAANMAALNYLEQTVFPTLHPDAEGIEVIERQPRPDLAQRYRLRSGSIPWGGAFQYDGGSITVTYCERGKLYTERLWTVIEDLGYLGGGIWGNHDTHVFRAPKEEFETLRPMACMVLRSSQINPMWATAGMWGTIWFPQEMLQMQLAAQGMTWQPWQANPIAYINMQNNPYLEADEQAIYVSPFNNQLEAGSALWSERWENITRDLVYTNDTTYDPNTDTSLVRRGFQKSHRQ